MSHRAKRKQEPQTANEHLRRMEKAFRDLAYRHHLFTVFREFVELSALSLSNAIDPLFYKEREDQYLKIISRYKPEELKQMTDILGMLVLALEHEMSDVLGTLYHRLELHNEQRGQFFTPYNVCLLMAKMAMYDSKPIIEKRGFVQAMEPCSGAGAMVIALAQAMRDEGTNYQEHLHVTAVDVDIIAVHMTYIQLYLLHVPAIVWHANSLSDSPEDWHSQWRTMAHVIGFWPNKLARNDQDIMPKVSKTILEARTAPAEHSQLTLF